MVYKRKKKKNSFQQKQRLKSSLSSTRLIPKDVCLYGNENRVHTLDLVERDDTIGFLETCVLKHRRRRQEKNLLLFIVPLDRIHFFFVIVLSITEDPFF